MPTTCVVNCGSRGDRDCVKFFKVPSELHFPHRADLNELSKQRRQKWIQAIRREDLTEGKLKYSRVCSKHFLTGKPSELNNEDSSDWVPSLAMGYGKEELVLKRSHNAVARQERAKKRRKVLLEDLVNRQVVVTNETEQPSNTIILEAEIDENDKHCQTEVTVEDFTQIMLSLESTKKLEAKIQKIEMCFNFLKNDDIKTKYYIQHHIFYINKLLLA